VDTKDDHRDHQHDSRFEDGDDVALCSPPKRKGLHTHRSQSYRRRDGLGGRNWFTHTGDSLDERGPGTAHDAFIDPDNQAVTQDWEYESWKKDTFEAWREGKSVFPK
jgi:hypothetical protein